MKLSRRLLDFLDGDTEQPWAQDLLGQAEELESDAENWRLLKRLPGRIDIAKRGNKWAVIDYLESGPGVYYSNRISNGDTPEEALQRYFETTKVNYDAPPHQD